MEDISDISKVDLYKQYTTLNVLFSETGRIYYSNSLFNEILDTDQNILEFFTDNNLIPSDTDFNKIEFPFHQNVNIDLKGQILEFDYSIIELNSFCVTYSLCKRMTWSY